MSEKFNDQLDDLSKNVNGLGQILARELLPELIKATDKMLDFVKGLPENKGFAANGALVIEVEGIKELG